MIYEIYYNKPYSDEKNNKIINIKIIFIILFIAMRFLKTMSKDYLIGTVILLFIMILELGLYGNVIYFSWKYGLRMNDYKVIGKVGSVQNNSKVYLELLNDHMEIRSKYIIEYIAYDNISNIKLKKDIIVIKFKNYEVPLVINILNNEQILYEKLKNYIK